MHSLPNYAPQFLEMVCKMLTLFKASCYDAYKGYCHLLSHSILVRWCEKLPQYPWMSFFPFKRGRNIFGNQITYQLKERRTADQGSRLNSRPDALPARVSKTLLRSCDIEMSVLSQLLPLLSIDHFHTAHNAAYFPPAFCMSIVFSFSWEYCSTEEKLETKVMQNVGGNKGCIVGNLKDVFCKGT